MIDERPAIQALREKGTPHALSLAQEIERGWERHAAEEAASPTTVPPPTDSLIHEYGTQDTARFCRQCHSPTQWMCFTCHKHLCSICVEEHAAAVNGQFVGHKGLRG
jgi:hypothetical protein